MKSILLLWLSLYSVWFFMTAEMTVTSALIAHLPNATLNLAAYGISVAILIFFEAPILSLISGSISLVKDPASFQNFRKFALRLSVTMSCLLLIACIPDLNKYLLVDAMDLPPDVVRLVQTNLCIMCALPFFVGYRRFYQGIVVGHGRSRVLVYCTMLRLTAVTVTGLTCFNLGLEGALVGGISNTAGMILESLACRFAAAQSVESVFLLSPLEGFEMTERKIRAYYMPLAITACVQLAMQPLSNYFVAHCAFPVESLAVLPVVSAFLLPFLCASFAYQEVINARSAGGAKTQADIYRLGQWLGIVLLLICTVVAFTHIGEWWFRAVFHFEGMLLELSLVALQLQVAMATIRLLQGHYRGVLIHERHTRPIKTSAFIELFSLGIVSWILATWTDFNGAVVASIAANAAALAGVAWLVRNHLLRNKLSRGS